MNKKGFTLVELLAVVVILALILAIAVPVITSLISNSRQQAYQSNEKMMVKAVKLFLASNSSYYPVNIGDTKEVSLNQLKSSNFITSIVDPSSK